MSNYDDTLFTDRDRKVRGIQKLLQPQTPQAVMVIRAGEKMGKTWLARRVQRLSSEGNGTPIAHIDFRHPREIHDIQTFLGVVRLLRDRLARPGYFYRLNATINRYTGSAAAPGLSALAPLVEKMQAAFDLADLRRLAVYLDVEFENLEGTTLFDKSYSLARYFQRRGELERLIARLQVERPALGDTWWQGLETLRAQSTDPAQTGGKPVQDRGDLLPTLAEQERRFVARRINEAFFAAVAELAAAERTVVFIFDGCENAPPEVAQWIVGELLARLADRQLGDAVVILAGRTTPDLSALNISHLLVETDLEPFTEEDIREYFEVRRRVPPGLDYRTIFATSGGVPGELALMADRVLARAQKQDPFFDD